MSENKIVAEISYFPGCSLATSAKENNQSLLNFCSRIGCHLKELEDWNCCGSSSAHSINSQLAFDLASRNLSLAPPDKPLLAACPSCLLHLRHAHLHLKKDEAARTRYEKKWGRPFDPELNILHFFELLSGADLSCGFTDREQCLKGIRFVPYYGCMLARPPAMNREKNYYGLMEKVLSSLGAEPLIWAYPSRCCGTFLSAARPDIVTPVVNKIVRESIEAGADCIVTACAMCHMNLELRCSLKQQIPVLHFSELLSLALGAADHKGWFSRHLVDPRPLLKSKGLI
jgi:heterodisulfide reductase subunit B